MYFIEQSQENRTSNDQMLVHNFIEDKYIVTNLMAVSHESKLSSLILLKS
jgi:hypothetical protein